MHDAVKAVYGKYNAERTQEKAEAKEKRVAARDARRKVRKQRKENRKQEADLQKIQREKARGLAAEIKIEALAAIKRLGMLDTPYVGGEPVCKKFLLLFWWKGVIWKIEGSSQYFLLHDGNIYHQQQMRFRNRHEYVSAKLHKQKESTLDFLKRQLKVMGLPPKPEVQVRPRKPTTKRSPR